MKKPLFHCECGARIAVTPEQKGQAITCVACGRVFPPREIPEDIIPEHTEPPAEGGAVAEDSALDDDGPASEDPHAWLNGFSRNEATAPAENPPELYDLAEEPEPPAPPFPIPEVVIEVDREDDDDEEEEDPGLWDNPPERPFWQDLLASFTFVFETGNLITLGVIIAINIWSVFLRYALCFGVIGQLLLSCYLAAFYLSVIRETAGGEDDLPDVWIHSVWDDLILPGLQFVASGIIVMVPALLLMIGCLAQGVQVPWEVVAGLAVAGVFFWPVVILAVAIGGGFRGLWPHTVIQTVLAAPLAFLTIWGVLLISGGLYVITSEGTLLTRGLDKLLPNRPDSVFWLILVLSATVSAYSAIVAMRTIGLFYRHFKKQLPWRAE